MQMLVGWGNAFPSGRVPVIFQKLQIGKFFEGFLTYSDLTDREESGELFDAAYTYMVAQNDAEKIIRQREEARARRQ